MYRKNTMQKSSLKVNAAYTGETIEEKINRITNNKEPISDGAPIVYTERKDGVLPEYNIRTDRFEIAVDAMSHVEQAHKARREERHKPKEEPKKDNPGTGANTSDNSK